MTHKQFPQIAFLLVLALTLQVSTASAQKRKTTAKKVVKVEKTPEQLLYEELLPSTAKIMFVDSLVVDRATFLSAMQLPTEMGTLSAKGARTSYTDEFALTRITADGDSTSRALVMARRAGTEWETDPATPLRGGQEIGLLPDYPFLLTDGVTLYFSAEGEGTVGGRDLFRTTYDADGMQFYEPVNMGLPYNSPANDYLLAISEYDNLGWLVTDRNQEDGRVCIYTFEPTATRSTFGEDADPEEVRNYAMLTSIEQSWGYGDVEAAKRRKAEMFQRITSSTLNANNSRARGTALEEKQAKLDSLNKLLESSRENYAKASRSTQRDIGRKIIALEIETEQLQAEIDNINKGL